MESITPRKVLIVDNDVIAVIQAEGVLSKAGFTVSRLLSPAGLYAKLEYERPDVLLLDTEIPGMQPEAVFQRLRSGEFDDLVLVLFSARSPEELHGICLQNELFNGYFSKSMDFAQLPAFLEGFFQE